MTKSPISSRRQQSKALIAVANNLSPFGNKLVQSGFIEKQDMEKALVESRKSKRSLTDLVEQLTGKQLSPDLIRQYKKQQLFELKILYGVDSLDPEINEIDTNQVNELIDTLIPLDLCRRYQLVPLSKNN
ncbi:MAG TPA: general secretion pathway protein GspE, partial [Cyanobacteria bacterium UBA11691]|nr:general secretion pathway protein GspE [Cyanobacteria bacterium UBA11691]